MFVSEIVLWIYAVLLYCPQQTIPEKLYLNINVFCESRNKLSDPQGKKTEAPTRLCPHSVNGVFYLIFLLFV